MFTGLALVLGSLWGRPVWGIWWAWDARLVTTGAAVLPLPRLPRAAPHPGQRPRSGAAKRNAIAALIAFVDVPIVHFSVEWWRTLHQKATVFNPRARTPQIHGVMALTLWIGVIAFTLVYVYLLDRRYRLAVLEEGREERALAQARSPERTGVGRERGAGVMTDAGYVIAGWVHHGRGARRLPVVLARRIRRAEAEQSARSVRDRHRTPTPPTTARTGAAGAEAQGRYVAAVAVCGLVVVVAIVVLLVVLADNVVFFRTVSEAVHDRTNQGTSRFRLAGAVVPGTVHETNDRRRLRGHRRQEDGARRPRGRPARAVQGGGAGRVRGPLGHGRWCSTPTGSSSGTAPSTRRRRSTTDRRRPAGRASVRGAARRPRHRDRRRGARCVGIVVLLARTAARRPRSLRLGRRCVVRRAGRPRSSRCSRWSGRCSRHDFSIKYVAENNARATPLLFTVTGLWAALEGSILLWALILGGYLVVRRVPVPQARRRPAGRVGDARRPRRSRCSSSC